MASQNSTFGIPLKMFVYPLIAIIIASIGFGVYLGKFYEEKMSSEEQWITFKTSQGLQVKYPPALRRSDGTAPASEFVRSDENAPPLFHFSFYDPNYHQGQPLKYPLVYFVILPNPQNVAFETWVADFYKYVTPPSETAPAGKVLPPEKITLGGKEGMVVRMTDSLGKTYVFLPLKDNTILAGMVSNNIDFKPEYHPMTKESEQLLFSILATVDDSQLSQ